MNLNLDFSNSSWNEYSKKKKKNTIRVESIWFKRILGGSASCLGSSGPPRSKHTKFNSFIGTMVFR